jgi:hypothetical protein
MKQFGLQLVVLAHAYVVPALKRVCTDSFEQGLLNSDNVVDVLHIARYDLINDFRFRGAVVVLRAVLLILNFLALLFVDRQS